MRIGRVQARAFQRIRINAVGLAPPTGRGNRSNVDAQYFGQGRRKPPVDFRCQRISRTVGQTVTPAASPDGGDERTAIAALTASDQEQPMLLPQLWQR